MRCIVGACIAVLVLSGCGGSDDRPDLAASSTTLDGPGRGRNDPDDDGRHVADEQGPDVYARDTEAVPDDPHTSRRDRGGAGELGRPAGQVRWAVGKRRRRRRDVHEGCVGGVVRPDGRCAVLPVATRPTTAPRRVPRLARVGARRGRTGSCRELRRRRSYGSTSSSTRRARSTSSPSSTSYGRYRRGCVMPPPRRAPRRSPTPGAATLGSVTEVDAKPLDERLEEIGAQLAWVRDYL